MLTSKVTSKSEAACKTITDLYFLMMTLLFEFHSFFWLIYSPVPFHINNKWYIFHTVTTSNVNKSDCKGFDYIFGNCNG